MAEQHGKALVPQIRFAGFTDPWEQRKLGQHLKLSRELGHTGVDARKLTVKLWGKGVVEKTDLYGGSAQTQYYIRHAGQFMYGKLDFLHAAFGVVPDKLDCFESTLDSPAFDIEGLDSSFLLNLVTQEDFYLKNGNIANGSRKAKRIHEETFLNMEIRAPELVEQRRIGAFLDRLDSLITLHQRKYDKLCVLKKSMLDKMFPKGGSMYPEIRFAGFTDPWEQRKLGELASKRIEKNTNGIKETFTNSAEHGVVSQLDYFDHDITNDANIGNYSVVHPDDFIYNPRISAVAPCGPINRNKLDRNGVMSPLYTVFSVDDTIDKLYLEHYFKTSRWHQFMFLEGNSGARSDRFSISDSIFFEMPIQCPVLEEQELIASFFGRLDSLITLHQRKYCGVVSWMLGVALVRLSSEK